MADLDWRGEALAKNIYKAALQAARAGAELLRDEAVERTPIETGTLRGTAKVSDNGQRTAAVSYNTPYAARQHEEVGWNHPGGGQAKFLETAAIDNQDAIRAAMADQIRGTFQ